MQVQNGLAKKLDTEMAVPCKGIQLRYICSCWAMDGDSCFLFLKTTLIFKAGMELWELRQIRGEWEAGVASIEYGIFKAQASNLQLHALDNQTDNKFLLIPEIRSSSFIRYWHRPQSV